MKTKVVITAWNDKPIPKGFSVEEYEKIIKTGWELMLSALLFTDNTNNDEFVIESVELEE